MKLFTMQFPKFPHYALHTALVALSSSSFVVTVNNRHWQQHQHHQQPRHLLPHPPMQHGNNSSFCQINFSSLDQQTTRVTLAVLILLRCKPRLTSTCMNFGQLCQKKMPSPSGADSRQPIHCLPHWPKTF